MHRLEDRVIKNLTWVDKPQASFKYIFMVFTLILNMATTSQGADVKAIHGVAAGRDITAHDIIFKSGLTEKDTLGIYPSYDAFLHIHVKPHSDGSNEVVFFDTKDD